MGTNSILIPALKLWLRSKWLCIPSRDSHLFQIRLFYLAYREKVQTVPALSCAMDRAPGRTRTVQTPSAESGGIPRTFPLPWSHDVRLLSVEHANARAFYDAEARRGFSKIKPTEAYMESVEEAGQEKPRRARGWTT